MSKALVSNSTWVTQQELLGDLRGEIYAFGFDLTGRLRPRLLRLRASAEDFRRARDENYFAFQSPSKYFRIDLIRLALDPTLFSPSTTLNGKVLWKRRYEFVRTESETVNQLLTRISPRQAVTLYLLCSPISGTPL